jgi:hypothetical protein
MPAAPGVMSPRTRPSAQMVGRAPGAPGMSSRARQVPAMSGRLTAGDGYGFGGYGEGGYGW